jgi:hypothetical protein
MLASEVFEDGEDPQILELLLNTLLDTERLKTDAFQMVFAIRCANYGARMLAADSSIQMSPLFTHYC